MPRTHRSTKADADSGDAIKMLMADHKEVSARFDQYRKMCEDVASDDEKQALAQEICAMLTVHTTIEEEMFYPAARDVIEEAHLVDEALVEHASAKDLIAQIEGSSPDEELYDAKVEVLGEYVKHHVKEEESELFPQAKKAKLDVEELGARMMKRKHELMAEVGLAEESAAH